MEFFRSLDQVIEWLENKAILSCHDQQHKRFQQVEWQLAKQLRVIKQLINDEDWDGLKKFVNKGDRWNE